MSDPRQRDEDPWRAATWEGAEESALRAGAALSLPERLRWLEQAAALARRLGGAKPVSNGGSPRDGVGEVAESPADPSVRRD